mgnify:CR=1 FL=1
MPADLPRYAGCIGRPSPGVRYRITATDARGESARMPYVDDSSFNFACFVYDGVPGWSGRATPSSPTLPAPGAHW